MAVIAGQLSLLDPEPAPQIPSGNSDFIGAQRHETLADVYIATLKGGGGRRLMRMSADDARLLCSRPETQGRAHGSPWALFWTQYGVDDVPLAEFERDDGRFNELMARLGIGRVLRRGDVCS